MENPVVTFHAYSKAAKIATSQKTKASQKFKSS